MQKNITNVGINIQEKASLIWSIADVLRNDFKPHEYGEVILPMTVIKRFHDCLLPQHESIIATYNRVKGSDMIDEFVDNALTRVSKYKFYNTSKFTFKLLLADAENIKDNFSDYVSGFSDNVQDILKKFDMDNIITRLYDSNTLYLVLKEFNSEKGYLGPDKIAAVDCGYIFEDLIKRFSESYNEEAGAHFTSRDIIYLMTDILLEGTELKDEESITVYDMAMGTSQMLSCMEERIHAINKTVTVDCYGQEVNPSTYAIAKADMIIRNGNPNNMRFGDTLSDDQFIGYDFKYIISNPPFGIDWKKEKKAVEKEHNKGEEGRFAPGLPKISDGQQLFVLNGISKLAEDGKMAIIQNGSPLFSGDAGSGPSEIRRYILERDWLETIVQLPTDSFMNTGISTYIWVINKHKEGDHIGRVQLLDASHCYEQRRKSIGKKRNDITDTCRNLVVNAYTEFINDKIYASEDDSNIYCESKVFDVADFGYHNITVDRPLRLKVEVTRDNIDKLKRIGVESIELMAKMDETFEPLMDKTYMDYQEFVKDLNEALPIFADKKTTLNKKDMQLIRSVFATVDENAEKVIESQKKGVITYEADSALRDTENIPLKEDIEEYFQREVLPYAPDAWIDHKKTKLGYEIPMTRYFYKYQQPEAVEDITARINDIETRIAENLKKLFN